MASSIADLAEAVSGFLDEIAGDLEGRRAFHAKVAQNALAIIAREDAARPLKAELAWYAQQTGAENEQARAAFCEQLRSGHIAPDDPHVMEKMIEFVTARLAVDNPKFPTLSRLRKDEA
ncbi:MAG: DUF6285 domain-containing protein [Pacificimonas sp.]